MAKKKTAAEALAEDAAFQGPQNPMNPGSSGIEESSPIPIPPNRAAMQANVQKLIFALLMDLVIGIASDKADLALAKRKAGEIMQSFTLEEQIIALRTVEQVTGRLYSAVPRLPEIFAVDWS